jgi:hypothetical protein
MRRSTSSLVLSFVLALSLVVVPGAVAEIPNPIDPSSGEQNLLDIIDGLPLNEIEAALDNFPIPYVVVASANGAAPTIETKKAGSPIRIDADASKATGRGGNDIEVEVNTELLPTPHLVLDINRIGTPPFAEDLSVIVAFPFSAFNDEALPAAPNLFFGYSTTAPFDGAEYPAGGSAPTSVQIDLTPDILGGTTHVFDLNVATTGADNPVRFLGGAFDGDPGLTPVNAIGFSALTDPVPANLELVLDVDFSQILMGGTSQSDVAVSWTASASSNVIFEYLENESFPFVTPDYSTTLTFNQMPTSEQFSLGADFAAGEVTLSHVGSSPIGALTLLHEREDGLMIKGVASDVPTNVALTLGTNGSASVDVNANTMDLNVVATQEGGFINTSDFFGFDVGYLSLVVEDVPDLTAAWDAAEDRFEVHATNPDESIPLIELIMDDDATIAGDVVTGLDLPPSWDDVPAGHIFSLFDDGSHGTAAARAVHLSDAVLDLTTTSVGYHFEWGTTQAAPLQAHLSTTMDSSLTGEDIEVTCDVEDIPAGLVEIDLGFPPPTIDFDYTSTPPAVIDTVACAGNVGTLNFLMSISQLPPVFGFEFDPDASLEVTAGDGVIAPPSASVGQLLLRLWDEDGPTGLPDTDTIFGVPLRDAVAQVDEIPSFVATWADDPTGTDIDFDTVADVGPFAFLGGAQIQVSTDVELSTPLALPSPEADHYVSFVDEGADARKRLDAGVFGIDHFSYQSTEGGGDRTLAVQYDADEDHRLVVDIDSALGGRFFPDYEITAEVVIDDVPQTWDFATNLATELTYVGSDSVDSVAFTADIGVEVMPAVVETTHIEAEAVGLPADVEYFLDPTIDGSAFVHMSAPIDRVTVELTSDDAILEGPYRHMLFNVEDIPANWDAEWGVTPNPHASLTTSSPLGPVDVVISRDVAANTPSMYDPFLVPGGAVDYSDFTREIDRRYFRQGSGDDALRETEFMTRLDSIYDTTAQLDVDEDHIIIRENGDGDMEFLSIQGTGFQSISAEADSTVTATLEIPFVGDHPFYVGLEDSNDEFTVVQIANIPDTTTVEVGSSHANVDFSSAPGDILVYQGPLPAAGQTGDVLKVLVVDTPTFVHTNWDLGFPGGINIDTSNPTEVRLLSQGSGDRTVVDFAVGDLTADWGFTTGTTTEKCQLDPPGCGEYLKIAEVFFDFEADPAMEGFLASYERIGGLMDLTGDGPVHADNEYVPRTSVLVDGFSHFDASVEFEICLIGVCPIGVPTVGHTIDTDLLGSFNFDWWDLGGGFEDFFGDPDYVSNDPWDFWPVFHSQNSHLFPFE